MKSTRGRGRAIRPDPTYTPPVPEILLATLNARYAHAAFGLRYLMANLPDALRGRAEMLEFDISQRPVDVIGAVLARQPRIVGLGVYIWNAEQSLRVAADLKRLRPEILLVLGGPEVSYETDQQQITAIADYVITGEADLAFGQLCEKLLNGRRPLQKVFNADLPEFTSKAGGLQSPGFQSPGLQSRLLELPYDLYTDRDLAHRVVYVEASRGCPFKCEFCLSSLDVPVRNVPLDALLAAMQKLLDRGLRQFKFVDRTFNLNLNIGKAILGFFLERYTPGLFLHFEMIPDRLPEALRELIARFPPGALQFEVGIQTFNEDVSDRISRRQDNAKVEENFRYLREQTGVHLHADLIVGLPGEDLDSFGRGFDRLVGLRPQEIQVGILKRLRGTPIVRHDDAFGMVYSPAAPYEVLQTAAMDFATLQRLRRFSRYWDLVANSGNFRQTVPLIWESASPFERFLRLSDWLWQETKRTHGIALPALTELLFRFLTGELNRDPATVARAVWADYQSGGRSDRPAFLRPYILDTELPSRRAILESLPRRQSRHLS